MILEILKKVERITGTAKVSDPEVAGVEPATSSAVKGHVSAGSPVSVDFHLPILSTDQTPSAVLPVE